MAVDDGPEGYGFRLRPVVADDAPFILRLRLDPERGAYLGATDPDESNQRAWIEQQRIRPNDHYFVIEDSSARSVGAVGVYGRDADGAAEWGRWVLDRGSLAAPASVLLLLRFAFVDLELPAVHCRTIAENRAVVAFHDRCPYTSRSLERRDDVEFVVHRLERGGHADVVASLELAALRVAQRMALR